MTGQVYKLSLKFTTIATIMEMVFTFNRNTVVHKLLVLFASYV